MFWLDRILTTTFLSAETLTGQGLSSVLAITLRRQTNYSANHRYFTYTFKTTNCDVCLHKIRVDGTADGVFRELVHDISGWICAPRLSDISLAWLTCVIQKNNIQMANLNIIHYSTFKYLLKEKKTSPLNWIHLLGIFVVYEADLYRWQKQINQPVMITSLFQM